MATPSGYSIADYGDMIDCEPRMSIYAEALKRAVTPGCSVVDIGAGFGVFALLACKYGAGSVVAIETDSSIELLHELAQANGYADRIKVVRGISTRFEPESKADVIISDLRGTVPLYESHIATIVDARERLLAKGGRLLPMRDTLRIALVRSPKTYRPYRYPWSSGKYGIDLSAARRFAVNDSSKEYLKPSALMSEATDLAIIDYRSVTNPHVDSTVELAANRDSTAHGLLVWFDAEIADGLTYSNAPGQPPLVYGQMFLPFAQPVALKSGQTVVARIQAKLLGPDYTWGWDCEVRDEASEATKLSFQQSTFLKQVHVPEILKAGSDRHTPDMTPMMEIDQTCLGLVKEGRSLGEIAQVITDKYADQLTTFERALDHVANLMRRY